MRMTCKKQLSWFYVFFFVFSIPHQNSTGVLGQHSLNLVYGGRKLKEAIWPLDRLSDATARVSCVPMGRMAFQLLP